MNVTLWWENILDEKNDGWELEPLHWFLAKMVQIKNPKWKNTLDESRIFHPWDKFYYFFCGGFHLVKIIYKFQNVRIYWFFL